MAPQTPATEAPRDSRALVSSEIPVDEGRGKHRPLRLERRKGPVVKTCAGLSPLEAALLAQKDPADGHRRARAVQVSHKGPADFRISRQLA